MASIMAKKLTEAQISQLRKAKELSTGILNILYDLESEVGDIILGNEISNAVAKAHDADNLIQKLNG